MIKLTIYECNKGFVSKGGRENLPKNYFIRKFESSREIDTNLFFKKLEHDVLNSDITKYYSIGNVLDCEISIDSDKIRIVGKIVAIYILELLCAEIASQEIRILLW